MKKTIIAHLRKLDQRPQPLWDHLNNVSIYSGQFAEKIGLKGCGELLGKLHDLGKASLEFQNYIASANGLINPDADGYVDAAAKKGEIDHSTAGAQWIYDYFQQRGIAGKFTAQLLSLCIASHHSGLIDCISPGGENKFLKRIKKDSEKTHYQEALSNLEIEDKEEIDQLFLKNIEEQIFNKLKEITEENDSKDTINFKFGLLVRFLLSCLIDADRLDTANFESPQDAKQRNDGIYQKWEILIDRLNNKIRIFDEKKDKNKVDFLRNKVSISCYEFSRKQKGIYQLEVPTGGGKTFSSLRFALNHAAIHKMERIFYIIPFTSIIDQNADEVRKILEEKNAEGNYLDKVVLEHHSNLTPEEESKRHNLLSENWDAPIIFTTQVQFLETLFNSGTRSARRMHQLANSVIIFDEVQTIPIRCVHMFNVTLRFLVKTCGSTVVLCTATQPLLDKVEPITRALSIPIENKIIPNAKELYKNLKRVKTYDYRKKEGWTNEEIVDLANQELNAQGSVLIIVNTKKSARTLYQSLFLRKNSDIYHLSTNMCPAHRLNVLNEIKLRLEKNIPVTCVSTQLIEAGVDIDFGSVIRFQAGLDSITQAAGRCNRNGKKENGNVWIINPILENIDRLKDIQEGIFVSDRILNDFKDNPMAFDNDQLGLKAMEKYYTYYFYSRKEEMSYRINKTSLAGVDDTLFNLLANNSNSIAEFQRIGKSEPLNILNQSFQTAAKIFSVIDSYTQGVIVQYKEEGENLVNDLCAAYDIEKQFKLLKKAQKFSINLFPYQFIKMADQKAIQEVQEGAGIFYLNKQYYSQFFGWSDEIVNDMEFLMC